MTDLPEHNSAVDHYEAALEATCDTLITLQLVSAAASRDEIGDVEEGITGAISSLRSAIAELRLAHTEGRTARVLGFVLASDVADNGGAT